MGHGLCSKLKNYENSEKGSSIVISDHVMVDASTVHILGLLAWYGATRHLYTHGREMF